MKRGPKIFSEGLNSSFSRHWEMSSAVDPSKWVAAALSWTKPLPPERTRQPLSKTFRTLLFRNLTLEPFDSFLKLLNLFNTRTWTNWCYLMQHQIQMVLNDYKLFLGKMLGTRNFYKTLEPINKLFWSHFAPPPGIAASPIGVASGACAASRLAFCSASVSSLTSRDIPL